MRSEMREHIKSKQNSGQASNYRWSTFWRSYWKYYPLRTCTIKLKTALRETSTKHLQRQRLQDYLLSISKLLASYYSKCTHYIYIWSPLKRVHRNMHIERELLR